MMILEEVIKVTVKASVVWCVGAIAGTAPIFAFIWLVSKL